MSRPPQATNKSGDMSRQAGEGKVLIESAGNNSWKAENCISSHTKYSFSEISFLLKSLPQVIMVSDAGDFCAEMRALGCAVWTREEWQGTAAAWSEAEKRLPPFRIGNFEVIFKNTACVELFSGQGGGVRFSLEKCEAYADYGTDRMNAGGFRTSFDKCGTVTAGEVYRWAARFIKDCWDYSLSSEKLSDATVLWPVTPYAGFISAKPVEATKPSKISRAKPVAPARRDLTGRSEAAIRRDEKMRAEARTKRESETRNMFYIKLLPFLNRHAGGEDWDNCAKQIFAYFGFSDGDFYSAAKERHWDISEDRISCTKTWASHSFFDDGGGISGYSKRSISYVSGIEENIDEPHTVGRNAHRYSETPVHEYDFVVDPFGLKGTYRLSHDREEEYTD